MYIFEIHGYRQIHSLGMEHIGDNYKGIEGLTIHKSKGIEGLTIHKSKGIWDLAHKSIY